MELFGTQFPHWHCYQHQKIYVEMLFNDSKHNGFYPDVFENGGGG